MIPNIAKDQLIEMLVNKTLFSFLMKKNVIKKGDSICYGKLLDMTTKDLIAYFEKNGYPEMNPPRKLIRTTPEGSEGDTVWTLAGGVYKVWYIERNMPTEECSTESRSEFETWWKEYIVGFWEYKLYETWKL